MISIGSVSPSGVMIVDVVLVKRTLKASIRVSGIPCSARISNILSLFIESKALLKSTKTKTASLLQLLISSIIIRRARIWLNKVERSRLESISFFL